MEARLINEQIKNGFSLYGQYITKCSFAKGIFRDPCIACHVSYKLLHKNILFALNLILERQKKRYTEYVKRYTGPWGWYRRDLVFYMSEQCTRQTETTLQPKRFFILVKNVFGNIWAKRLVEFGHLAYMSNVFVNIRFGCHNIVYTIPLTTAISAHYGIQYAKFPDSLVRTWFSTLRFVRNCQVID